MFLVATMLLFPLTFVTCSVIGDLLQVATKSSVFAFYTVWLVGCHITSTGLMYNEFTFEILFSFYGYIWVVKMCPSVTLTMAGLKTGPH
jgi:hypothetical protein